MMIAPADPIADEIVKAIGHEPIDKEAFAARVQSFREMLRQRRKLEAGLRSARARVAHQYEQRDKLLVHCKEALRLLTKSNMGASAMKAYQRASASDHPTSVGLLVGLDLLQSVLEQAPRPQIKRGRPSSSSSSFGHVKISSTDSLVLAAAEIYEAHFNLRATNDKAGKFVEFCEVLFRGLLKRSWDSTVPMTLRKTAKLREKITE